MSHLSQNELNLRAAEDVRIAVQEKNLEGLIACFNDDCEIELFGLKLTGKDGVKKWFKWTYSHMVKIGFENVTAIIDGNVLFEEYMLNGVIHTGKKIRSRQMRSLIFENGKVKTFRLYMDRLQFADSIADDFASKLVISKFTQRSVREMLR